VKESPLYSSGLAHLLSNEILGGNSMKTKLALSFLALSSLAMIPGASFAAQDDSTQNKSDNMRTLTGCL
jgi:hypothetical protein